MRVLGHPEEAAHHTSCFIQGDERLGIDGVHTFDYPRDIPPVDDGPHQPDHADGPLPPAFGRAKTRLADCFGDGMGMLGAHGETAAVSQHVPEIVQLVYHAANRHREHQRFQEAQHR